MAHLRRQHSLAKVELDQMKEQASAKVELDQMMEHSKKGGHVKSKG